MGWPSDGSYTAWSVCDKLTSQASKITGACSWYFFDLSLCSTAWWAAVASDGDDIRFVEADGETAIYHRLILWDYGANTGLVALAQPHGASGASSDIESRVYAGNGAASSTSSASAWPSTLQALYMLQEAPTSSGAILDWTSNARHSTAIAGTMTSGDLVSGGPHHGLKAIDFDSNDRATVPSTLFDACESANAFTWVGWVRPGDDEATQGIFGGAGALLAIAKTDSPGLRAILRNSANTASFTTEGASEFVEGEWRWASVVYDGSTLKTFLNGVEKSSVSATSMRITAFNFYIGHDNSQYANSRLCEIGMYSEALSADQLLTMYVNMTDAGFWVVEEFEGDTSADVTGTVAASVGVSAVASGHRGVVGTVAASVDVAAATEGFRGVLGSVSAALSVAGAASAIRHLSGAVHAAVSLVGAALGFAGRYGTVAARVDVSASTTDYDGSVEGTVAASVSIGARAVGYVSSSLGPADGRALQVYLTGAEATGAPQRDPELSTGGYRSGVLFRSMEWDTADPLIGVTVIEVGGGNGQGVGSLTAASADSVTWTPPGGTAGAATALAAGAEIIAPGANTGGWARLRRTSTPPLSGTHAVQCIDVYNNLFPDVETADAVAGLVTARALMLRNTMGPVIAFKAWLGDCDGDIELALDMPVDGELTGGGLTWSDATTAETGPTLALIDEGAEVGLRIRRTVAADTGPSPSQAWEVRFQISDGTTTYTSAVRGRYRIEREDYIKEGLWIGIDEQPDFDGEPAETWTTRPHTTSLGLTLPAVVYAARRWMNKWGLWGIPTEVVRYNLDAEGVATRLAPRAPTDISVMQTSGNIPTVGAQYDAAEDGTDRGVLWAIWLATDGSTPDGSGEPDGYATIPHNAAYADLAWTSDGSALMDGTPATALVRVRRLDNAGGTVFSPDVIQLSDTGAGTLKVDAEIEDWPADGLATITTRFGSLLEVIHYSGIVVSAGQTTITVDQRELMGTTGTETNPTLLITPVVIGDSENTETATWTITAVAPGRPTGAMLYGNRGAQAQAPLEGPDGMTPQVLDAGEDVHLVLGEGWSSLYVGSVLVWRCLQHGAHGEDNGLYIPSEWTRVTGAVSGAASGPGIVDAVDADTIYLVVHGVRRVLIDLAAMEITASAWNASSDLEQRAEQDGALEQFGMTTFLGWDPEREDYRPYLQVAAAGAVGISTAIVEDLTSAEVLALWSS